jgi:hypothetical protein
MARRVYYDEQYGFVPYDDCPQDNLYSESEAAHTFSPSEPKTNADRIRSMTDDELAEWLERIRLCCTTDLCGRSCPFAEVCYSNAEAPKEMLDWLREKAGEDE